MTFEVKQGDDGKVRLDPATTCAVRAYLEQAAKEIEARAGNSTYKAAWKIAAKIVRDSKPD